MQLAIVIAVAVKAKPSRCALTSQSAARTAMMASSSTGRRKKVLVDVTWVQMANPTTAAAVNGATVRTIRRER